MAKFGFGKSLAAVALRKQSTKLSCVNEFILAKFEACLLGALIGDCIGKKFEDFWGPNLGKPVFRRFSFAHMLEYSKNDHI